MTSYFQDLIKQRSQSNQKTKRSSITRKLTLLIIAGAMISFPELAFAQFGIGGSVFRITPSTPEQLLNKVYNNALLGNDRLSDIEPYLSRDLRSRYKKAVKQVKKGKTCDVPRILSNKYFSGKLRGFKVEPANTSGRNIDAVVIINTGSENLPPNSEFKRFDPSVYEKITFKFTKQLTEWKIDDISASEPNLDDKKDSSPTYKAVDLREVLKLCN